MALQPSLDPLIVAGVKDAPHTLDVFIDYVCPYSAKIARKIDTILKSLFDKGGQYYGKVKVIVRLQVQPWHASSTLTHESALAVLRASPVHFWPYSLKLFEQQEQFYDIPTSTLTPLQIREKLVEIAGPVIGDTTKVEEVKELLKLKSTPNGGVAVTDDLKYNIKFTRQNGIHVSPTVLWDGLVAGEIGSAWDEKEWSEFLAKRVAV